ncbi:MAG: hypothetical protein HPY53_00695 [Brevinematales bacterium]|nr:hypothetical protein [Brevinematales bacterium]
MVKKNPLRLKLFFLLFLFPLAFTGKANAGTLYLEYYSPFIFMDSRFGLSYFSNDRISIDFHAGVSLLGLIKGIYYYFSDALITFYLFPDIDPWFIGFSAGIQHFIIIQRDSYAFVPGVSIKIGRWFEHWRYGVYLTIGGGYPFIWGEPTSIFDIKDEFGGVFPTLGLGASIIL